MRRQLPSIIPYRIPFFGEWTMHPSICECASLCFACAACVEDVQVHVCWSSLRRGRFGLREKCYGLRLCPLWFSTTMMLSVKASEHFLHMAKHMPLPPMTCGHFIAPTQVSGSLWPTTYPKQIIALSLNSGPLLSHSWVVM